MTEKKTQELNCYSSKLFHAIHAICRYVKLFFYCSSFPAEILNTARRDGNTLIVVDTAGRVLELSQLLVSTKDIHDCITNVIVEHICTSWWTVSGIWERNNGGAVGGGGGGTDSKICLQKSVLVPRPQKMFCTFLTRNTFGCVDKWRQSTWYENKFSLYPLTPLPSFPETVKDR